MVTRRKIRRRNKRRLEREALASWQAIYDAIDRFDRKMMEELFSPSEPQKFFEARYVGFWGPPAYNNSAYKIIAISTSE